MNCLEFRRLSLINPEDPHPARAAHRQTCDACARFANQLDTQDELLREATRIDVPEGFAARILLNQSLQQAPRRPTRQYWLGLAASILIAALILPSVLEDTFYQPFESELVAHVNKHDVLTGNAQHGHRADPGEMQQVFASLGADMPADTSNIYYASTCVVDGELMAHLLVKNGDQEYVVFLIPERSVARSFSRNNWSGQIVRVNKTSLAILNRDGRGLDAAATHFSSQFSQSLASSQQI